MLIYSLGRYCWCILITRSKPLMFLPIVIVNIIMTAEIDQLQSDENKDILTASIIDKFNEVFSDISDSLIRQQHRH